MSTEEGELEAKIKTFMLHLGGAKPTAAGKEGKKVKWVRMRMMCAFHLVTGGGETGVRLTYRMTSQGVKQEEIMPQGTFREQESRGGLSADSPAPSIFCFPLVIVCPIETAPRDTPCLRRATPLMVSQEARPRAAHLGASFTFGSGRNSGRATGGSVAEAEPGGPEWGSWAWSMLCQPSGWKLCGNQRRCRDWCPGQGRAETRWDFALMKRKFESENKRFPRWVRELA